MVEIDVEPVTNTVEDMFDGLAELNRWYNAPTLSIFVRNNRSSFKEHHFFLNLNPVERKLRVDDAEWIKEGLEIVEERRSKNNRLLVYSSSS